MGGRECREAAESFLPVAVSAVEMQAQSRVQELPLFEAPGSGLNGLGNYALYRRL